MNTGHFKVVCRKCGTIISQCRCPSQDKATQYGLCERCKKSPLAHKADGKPVDPGQSSLLDDAMGLLHNHEQHNDPEWIKDYEDACKRYDAQPAPSSDALRITGKDVHREWRDGMLGQGRKVAPERMEWEKLSEEDKALDERIAAALRAPAGDEASLRCRCGWKGEGDETRLDCENGNPPYWMACPECGTWLVEVPAIQPSPPQEGKS